MEKPTRSSGPPAATLRSPSDLSAAATANGRAGALPGVSLGCCERLRRRSALAEQRANLRDARRRVTEQEPAA